LCAYGYIASPPVRVEVLKTVSVVQIRSEADSERACDV